MPIPFHQLVTLPLADTTYNLFSLMEVVTPNAPRKCNTLYLASGGANTNNIAIGGSNMAAMTDGDAMFPTGSRQYKGDMNSVSTTEFYVRSDAADQQVFVHAILV